MAGSIAHRRLIGNGALVPLLISVGDRFDWWGNRSCRFVECRARWPRRIDCRPNDLAGFLCRLPMKDVSLDRDFDYPVSRFHDFRVGRLNVIGHSAYLSRVCQPFIPPVVTLRAPHGLPTVSRLDGRADGWHDGGRIRFASRSPWRSPIGCRTEGMIRRASIEPITTCSHIVAPMVSSAVTRGAGVRMVA